ncbi:MAG TPA: AEC family transporter [Beijerinckiaceae bacterium]|nr:AEC family transporter [Beijerinckiaceae bacterium]
MIETFIILFPIFAVILLGWLAVRLRFVGVESGNGLSEFVFVIAIPLMLFRTIATAPLPASPPWSYWLSYYLAMAIVWTIVAQVARRAMKRDNREASIIGFSVGQSNLVLISIPMVLRVFGEEGSVPLFLMVAVNLPITLTVATVLIETSDAPAGRYRAMLVKLATNPILIGIAAGLLWRQTGWLIPDPVMSSLKFIGDASAPCALFAMGAALSRYGLGGDYRLLALVVALKLLVFPAIVYLLAYKLFALPPVWAGVITMIAAAPCGINAYLLAERYRLGLGLTSGAIAVSTVLSVVTSTFWVWLVR